MAGPLALVGQAVVTDPQEGRASGYTLVAASPGVTPHEAQHLAETPQVTDHLHSAETPGPYVGWHRLASGRWALVRRFTSGLRRGRFHRVVVHSLLVPAEVLHAAGDDPWVLVARCRFRAPSGGGWQSLTALGDAVRATTVDALPDLLCEGPDDPQAARYDALAGRRDFLIKDRGASQVEADLGQILSALEAGRRVLLPQDTVGVQLLALAASSLPVADRLRLGWTTHLAVDAAQWFHLANVPEPATVRQSLDRPEDWFVVGEPLEAAPTGGAALARAVVEQRIFPNVLWGALRKDGAHLLPTASDHGTSAADLGSVKGLIEWLSQGGEQAYRGFDTAEALFEWLHGQPIGAGRSRCTREGALAAAAGTVLRMVQEGQAWDVTVDRVATAVDSAGQVQALLRTSVIDALRTSDAGDHGAAGLVAAVALTHAGAARRPDDVNNASEVVALLRLLVATTPNAGVPRAEVAAAVWQSLADDDGAAAVPAARLLTQVPGALAQVAQGYAELRSRHVLPIVAVFEAADAAGERAVATDLAGRLLLPLVWADRAARATLGDAALVRVLDRAPAASLAEVLTDGDPPLVRQAVQALRARAKRGDETVALIVARATEGTGQPGEAWLPTDASIAGLTALVASTGADAADWLVIGVAEARWLDAEGTPPQRKTFKAGLDAHAPIPVAAARQRAALVLDALRSAHDRDRLDAAHLALLVTVRHGLASEPARAAAVLAQLGTLNTTNVLRGVGPAVVATAEALDATAPADAAALRGNFWRALAQPRHQWKRLPASLVASFEALPPVDQLAVARAFAHKVDRLGNDAGNQALLAALRRVAAAEPELDDRYRIALDTQAGGSLLSTVLTLRGKAGPGPLLGALQRQLPKTYADKVRVVLSLIGSQELLPSERMVVEDDLLQTAVNGAVGREWIGAAVASIPDADLLARRTAVATRLAARVGARWQDDEQRARGFLKLLVDSEVFEAVAAFLAASEQRSTGLLARWATAQSPPRMLFQRLETAQASPITGKDLYVVRRAIKRAVRIFRSNG